jgi:hypothetical protein
MLEDRNTLYERILEIVEKEFTDIITGYKLMENKLRLMLIDNSYIDVWYSRKGPFFAYHWERRMIDGTIYRHNNIADPKARTLKTFPKHFHEGDDEAVKESRISDKPEEAIREFLEFAREKIKGKK